ncbi:MAG: hypothetical protein KBF89_04460 [Acidimicrobiia bacterium]|nr:hypothetical protein [Acidimicrobiia bacterium]
MNVATAHLETGYEAVIGLEVHCELSNNTKLFCKVPKVNALILKIFYVFAYEAVTYIEYLIRIFCYKLTIYAIMIY